MRNLVSLGLFALIFSLTSTSALAGKVEACEEIKEDPAYKGLYGLCNAYWNAGSDEARAEILANFQKKASKLPNNPGMPGLQSDSCPCWNEKYLSQIVTGLTGVNCEVDIDGISYDSAFYSNFGGKVVLLGAGYLPNAPFEGLGCVVGAFGVDLTDPNNEIFIESSVPVETTEDEDAMCGAQLILAIEGSSFINNCLEPEPEGY